MIDPIQSLAFSMQTNPGVYALLLGSGVSRSAGIPTGWEIVMDLLGKLAAASGQASDIDLERWYIEKYGEAPEYSKLLDSLAKTQSERQQLLRQYFEPNEQEREEGLKQPTTAHRAIARLVERGHVKVIVTTNFDRLIEKALEDAGVVPTVLSSVDQVQGALPLIHTRCCVVKLHGDYLDTRIRNSESELSEYPQELRDLLDRVLDEFGLVVCGWSADWDEALRNAVYRAKSRRFTTYWAMRGQPGQHAQQLIEHRQAQVMPIDEADVFFETVWQTVESLDEYSRPHPISIEATVNSLKRYLSNEEYRIQLEDLVNSEIDRMSNTLTGENFRMNGGPSPNQELVTARLRKYEAASVTVLSMAPIAGYWANDNNFNCWERALERLTTTTLGGGYTLWLHMRTYPAFILLYALGLGAVESGRLSTLGRLFSKRVFDAHDQGSPKAILTKLSDDILTLARHGRLLEGMESSYAPVNDWVHGVLMVPFQRLIADESRYSYAFDKLEILVSLGYQHLNKSRKDWFPMGAFIYRHENGKRVLAEISASISDLGHDSPFVESGIFGSSPEECSALLERFETRVREVSGGMGLFWYH